jgi:Domain of unknown function (DUF4440)
MLKSRRRFVLASTVLLGLSSAASRAQPVRSRVVTVTRLVKIFLDQESRLLDALEKRDRVALEGLLGDNFEMRLGAKPGVPIPRAEWLSAALAADAPDVSAYLVEQMAVHEMGNLAVASFLLQAADPAKKGAPPSVFVVDTWEPAGDAWRLRVRYAAPVAGKPPRISGEAVIETIPKKY